MPRQQANGIVRHVTEALQARSFSTKGRTPPKPAERSRCALSVCSLQLLVYVDQHDMHL